MGKRLLPGSEVCSRSPPMADRHCRQKLQEVVRRHQECKVAFQDLRSQIKSGLLEASDVFVSLSVPLMKLVGLKAGEMAADGKSSTIIIDPESQMCSWSIPFKSYGLVKGLAVSSDSCWGLDREHGNGFAREHAVSGDLRHGSDEKAASYSGRAKEACEEISAKQRLNAQRLVHLLRAIGVHLNARQENFHRALDNTRGSFRHFLKRAASFLSSLPPPQAQGGRDAMARLAVKVLHAAHEHVSSALEDVEEEADSLLRALAEATCAPMAALIRELRADAEGGAPARLSALVGEMEAALGEMRVEAAAARKRARVAEEERAEAVGLCRETQAALMGTAAIAAFRKGQDRRSPISTSPRLPIASYPAVRGTNGRDCSSVSKASITSPYSSVEPEADPMSKGLVLIRSRGRRYATCK